MFLVFIQKSAFPHFGVMSISALLKSRGHKCDLILASEEKDILRRVSKLSPDVVAFPCVTGEHKWVMDLAQRAKSTGVTTLIGGPHPTYYPEEVIKNNGVDVIAIGEADYACLELLDNLQKNEDIRAIRNLWVKKDNKIFKNEVRDLISNLDELPHPDREIYYKYPFLKKASVKQFLTGRGCPYLCTFCSNHLLQKIYKGKGGYIRRVSPSKVVDEMKYVKEKYGLKTVSFTDDVFIMSKKWLDEFLPMYKKEINLPFMCNVRVNLVTEEIIKQIKEYGCYGVAMGVESGNPYLRNVVLKKDITNEQIINAAEVIKKNGLKLKAFNMLGLPGETFENALETVKLNIKIKPDFAPCSLLEPYPGYDITKYAIEKGYLKENFGIDDVSESIYLPSAIEMKDKDKIINLQSFFFLTIKYPVLLALIKYLVRFKPNFSYRFVIKFVYGFYMSRIHRLTVADVIRYALHIDALQV